MSVENIIEEIEDFISHSQRVPVFGKMMIDDTELFHLVDNLRSELPREIDNAVEICQQRDEIIEAAQQEAARILDNANHEAASTMQRAQEFAQKAVEESTLVKQAQEQAER